MNQITYLLQTDLEIIINNKKKKINRVNSNGFESWDYFDFGF